MSAPERYVDLHLHSTHSDGADAPAEVAQRAAELGFAAIALTDHDSVTGLDEAREAAVAHGMEFMPGVEISANYGRFELHVLGLGISVQSEAIQTLLNRLKEGRSRRADLIIGKLNDLGIPITRKDVEARTANGTVGRLHLAQQLLDMGVTSGVQEGFDRFIGAGRKAYVPKKKLSCEQALAAIHEAGGLAVIAHPGVGRSTSRILPNLLRLPFDGIEVYHTRHRPEHVTEFARLAQEHGLLVTGGSDCHGRAKNQSPEMGKVRLPYAHFEHLKAALGQ